MKNLALAEEVLAGIEEEPSRLRMESWVAEEYPYGDCYAEWACGTAACLAGWTLIKAGGTPVSEDVIELGGSVYRGGSIGVMATSLLGLTDDEAWDTRRGGLFGELDNDMAIFRFRALIIAERERRAAS